jgi:hypothetical protein
VVITSQWWHNWRIFTTTATPVGGKWPSQSAGYVAPGAGPRRAVDPGPLDGRGLLKKPGVSQQLLPNLECGLEYEAIPVPVWRALAAWYGASPAIERVVTRVGSGAPADDDLRRLWMRDPKEPLQLEVYPLIVRASLCDGEGKVATPPRALSSATAVQPPRRRLAAASPPPRRRKRLCTGALSRCPRLKRR